MYDPKDTYDREIEKRILKALGEVPKCVSEIAKEAKTQRITALKHLQRLKAEGLVKEFEKPKMRLFVRAERGNNVRA